jgi:hypothetical protein
MKIDFQIIPHKRQRYDTCGDYFFVRKVLNFRVSKMSDDRYPILVFLHEMIEFFMCRLAGVKMKDIDRFDMEYEKWRGGADTNPAPCGCRFYEEPGDDPHAPYHLQHQTATQCEKIIAKALGVNWKDYNDEVEGL